MKRIVLVDSCCNLPNEFYDRYEGKLSLISMPIHLGEKDFLDDHGRTIPNKDFYEALRQGVRPSTSQISPNDFVERFNELAKDYDEIIYVAFSSGMSGTYQSAVLAKDMVEEHAPKITIVDSLCASVGYGVLIYQLMKALDEDQDLDIVAFVEEMKQRVHHSFTVDDLIFLKNGGRIPPALATIGTALNLKPMMGVDLQGKLSQENKVRGRKKVYGEFLKRLEARYEPSMSPVIIGHADCEGDATTLADKIKETMAEAEVIVTEASPTIGAHVGPGLMVIGFMGKDRATL